MRFTFYFNHKNLYALTALLGILLVWTPIVHADLSDDLQVLLDDAINQSIVTPGASFALTIPGQEQILLTSGKISSKSSARTINISDTFRLASISKTYIASLFMKVTEDNLEISNSKISKYLPNRMTLESIAGANKIKLKHLLQMRSGLIDYLYTSQFDKLQKLKPYYPLRALEATSFIYNSSLKFQPGFRYNYSNTNYVILGAIISKLSKKPLWQSLQDELTAPLNLAETKIERPIIYAVGSELTTRGHEKIKGRLKDVTKINDGLGLGDGGVISTAREVDLFVRNLFYDQTILKPESLNQMLNFKNSYGFGVEKEDTLWGLAYQHNGTSSGYQGQYYYFPNSGISWVLLTNSLDSDIIESFFNTSMNTIYQYLN